jgi:hypothetical protein
VPITRQDGASSSIRGTTCVAIRPATSPPTSATITRDSGSAAKRASRAATSGSGDG